MYPIKRAEKIVREPITNTFALTHDPIAIRSNIGTNAMRNNLELPGITY